MTGRPVFNGLGKGTKGVFKAGNEGDYRMDTISKYNAAHICKMIVPQALESNLIQTLNVQLSGSSWLPLALP